MYNPLRAFTDRQEQVIDAIRRDLSNREIAVTLGISESTVQGHINAIMYALRNPDELSDRMCIFQFAWWRWWHHAIEEREQVMAAIEEEARRRSLAEVPGNDPRGKARV